MTPTHKPPSQTFQYDKNIGINYECHGQGTHTLVMLHGFGASLETWRDISGSLAQSFTLYLIDLKGFGLSSKPHDNKYSQFDQARIIVAFLNFLKADHVILVGNSYGGGIALLTYFDFPENCRDERVAGLVLIDAAVYRQESPFFIYVLCTPILNRVLPRLLTADQTARMMLRKLFYEKSKVTAERIQRHSVFIKLPGSLEAEIATARQLIPKDWDSFVDRIKQTTAPALIIWGENDPIIPKAFAERFHRDIVRSSVKMIPQCGHVPQEEKPAETAKYIEEFVRTL